VNAVVGGYLRDLAFAQSSQQKMFGYKRAAAAILSLDMPLTDLLDPTAPAADIRHRTGSTRVIREILETGASPTVEQAIERSERRADIQRRRELRRHFLSRAEVRRILADSAFDGPTVDQYCGDLQMHSEWSDGSPTVEEIADACVERGYQYAAVTDHSYGLKIAGGMSMADAAAQRLAIESVNARYSGRFRMLQGIEANIDTAGQLDLTAEEAARFDVVLAAPHSRLRKNEDQTDRMLTAVQHPTVRILAHPRGRISGSRAGVIANWDTVFEAAAERGVAIEIDGDPARQDLDYTLDGRHSRPVASSRSIAMHTPQRSSPTRDGTGARPFGRYPVDRIVNCWPLERLLGWLSDPSSECRPLKAVGGRDCGHSSRYGGLVHSARGSISL
jgi:histidinol phosphatase-like PHP family hydrolase